MAHAEHHDNHHERRHVITTDNNIELILAGRTKKQSYDIPSVPMVHGKRQRKLIMHDLEFENLMGEVTGERYDYPCRPELQIMTIGHADSEPDHQHIIFNSATCLYILTHKIEDTIVSLLSEKGAELMIIAAICLVGRKEHNCLDTTSQRIFRRFIREEYLPILKQEENLKEILLRVEARRHHVAGGNSESETSSDESVEEKVVKKKAKRFAKKPGAAPPRSPSSSRPISATRASGTGSAMQDARDKAARNRLLSSSASKAKKSIIEKK